MNKNSYTKRLFISCIILMLSIFAILGFYPFNFLNLQTGTLFQRIISDFSIAALVLFVFIVVFTFIYGRFYCSVICPFGILQEIFTLIFKKENKKKKKYTFKYYILFLFLGLIIGGSANIARFIEPYTIFSSFISLSLFGIVITFFILMLIFFKDRFFCRNICPIGTFLGLISKFSINKISIDENTCQSCQSCEKNCPMGCIDIENKTVDNENCIRCLKCIKSCKKESIKLLKPKEKIKFNPKRRNLIHAFGVIILFGTAIQAGAEISKKLAEKIKNIILPPGAKNAKRMISKCYNCNLCINSCPNKILSKADSEFGAVHINFEQGEKYCKYDCINCSNVCPTGAIKKITLEEKQNTKIAHVSIEKNKCTTCSVCIDSCPKYAIKKINDKIVIDETKCIGCGKCRVYCPHGAINIYPINEQK